MCCGWSPFYAEDTQQMYRNICFGKIKFPRGAIGDDGKQFVKGVSAPKQNPWRGIFAQKLTTRYIFQLAQLLNRNPKHRLGAQRDALDLKEHPFFKDIDFEALSKKQVTPPFKPLVESDESVANFDPEFTETDLSEVAVIPGFEGEDARAALDNGGILSVSEKKKAGNGNGTGENGGGKTGGVAIKPDNSKKAAAEEAEPLTKSVQDKFRGFSYSGTYEEMPASFGGRSFGGRRGSAGLAGAAALGMSMSKMEVEDKSPTAPTGSGAAPGQGAPVEMGQAQPPSPMNEDEKEDSSRKGERADVDMASPQH